MAPATPPSRDHPAPSRRVVAGGSGLIGRTVIRMLRERGDDVVILVRRPPRSPALGYGFPRARPPRSRRPDAVAAALSPDPVRPRG